MNKKKKKSSKFSRIMKEIGKSIVELFKKLIEKFKKTSKEFKILLVIWILVLIIIFVVLGIFKANKKSIAEHKKIENEIKKAALVYVEDKQLFPTSDQKLRLNMEVLIQNGNLYKDQVTDNTCVGYALIYHDEEKNTYVIEPYLSCKSYVTDGYEVK